MGNYSKNYQKLKGSDNYTEWLSNVLTELASDNLLATLNDDYLKTVKVRIWIFRIEDSYLHLH